MAQLDFDAYRDIRFRPDRALLGAAGGAFRMHMFHPGFLFKRPVTVNVIRDGVPTPVPYQPQLFDYGRTKFERPLPVNLGFAGFRLHYPLNDPRVYDELIAFLGASYFRFLGREQRYGLSARGWPSACARRDGGVPRLPRVLGREPPGRTPTAPSSTRCSTAPPSPGAYQFEVYPGAETTARRGGHAVPAQADRRASGSRR